MGEREALLRAVCENPDDDLTRLVFADWLEEHGEPERAQFIRVQCELHSPFRQSGTGIYELMDRERCLFEAYESRWRADLPVLTGLEWGYYHRGFINALSVSRFDVFLSLADRLFASTPIEYLTLRGVTDPGKLSSMHFLNRLHLLAIVVHRPSSRSVRQFAEAAILPRYWLCFLGPHLGSSLESLLREKFGTRLSREVIP